MSVEAVKIDGNLPPDGVRKTTGAKISALLEGALDAESRVGAHPLDDWAMLGELCFTRAAVFFLGGGIAAT